MPKAMFGVTPKKLTSPFGSINIGTVCSPTLGNWTPIGTDNTKQYSGTFDGNGKKVANLYINTASDNQGLFGFVVNGTIKDLGVVNADVTGNSNVGGVAGYVNSSPLTACYSTGTVKGTARYVGGVAGTVHTSPLTACYSTGTVTGTDRNVGGVAGYVNSSTLTACYSTGTVTGTDRNVGGVAGGVTICTLTACYSTGTVSGTYNVGGVAGTVSIGTFTVCYSVATPITPNTTQVADITAMNGVVGTLNGAIITWNNTPENASKQCNYKYVAGGNDTTPPTLTAGAPN